MTFSELNFLISRCENELTDILCWKRINIQLHFSSWIRSFLLGRWMTCCSLFKRAMILFLEHHRLQRWLISALRRYWSSLCSWINTMLSLLWFCQQLKLILFIPLHSFWICFLPCMSSSTGTHPDTQKQCCHQTRQEGKIQPLCSVLKYRLRTSVSCRLQRYLLIALLLDYLPLTSWRSQGFHHWETLQSCTVLSLS